MSFRVLKWQRWFSDAQEGYVDVVMHGGVGLVAWVLVSLCPHYRDTAPAQPCLGTRSLDTDTAQCNQPSSDQCNSLHPIRAQLGSA